MRPARREQYFGTAQVAAVAALLLAVACVASAGARPANGEVGVPYLTNYDPKAYDSLIGYQNWAAVQDSRGVMYFGNTSGVVEFDGVSWRLIPIVGSTARSLAVDHQGRIFVGGQGTFGYLNADPLGQVRYHSLSDDLNSEDRGFRDVWKTHATTNGVYFQTFSHLFRWHRGGVRTWRPHTSFHMSFLVDGTVWVREEGRGLLRMVGNQLLPAPGGRDFAERRVYAMVSLGEGRILVGTRDAGFFLFDGSGFTPFATEADAYLAEAQLYHGTRLADGSIALATLRGGVVLVDEDGRLILVLDRSLGLQDSTVTSVSADDRGGLWLTLDRNITRVQIPASFTVFGERTGLIGAVNAITRHRGVLYAATTQGVYRLLPAENGSGRSRPVALFEAVSGIVTQCWDLISFDDQLLAATNDGIYTIRADRAQRISEARALALLRSASQPERVFVGIFDGVTILRRQHDRWIEEGRLGGLVDEVRSLAEDSAGKLWVGGRYRGVLRLLQEADTGSWHLEPFGEEHGLPPGTRRAGVYRISHRILVATGGGLYRLQGDQASFEPVDDLGAPFHSPDCRVTAVREGQGGEVWLVSVRRLPGTDTGVGVARPQDDGSYRWDNEAFRAISASSVLEIHPEPEGLLWLGTSNGLIRFDPEVPRIVPPRFQCLVRRVTTLADERPIFRGFGHTGGATTRAPRGPLPYHRNGLRFEFAAPLPGAQRGVEYRYRLEGFDRSWSEWSREVQREYTNLPEGRYSFKVEAQAPGGVASTTDSFEFVIQPPWHRTWWAATAFMLLAVAALWAFVQLQVRHARRKERFEAENRRRAFEMLRARRIQRNMLPSAPPLFPGLDIAAVQYTASEVGGDYYDFFPQPDGKLFVAIGDATGHGLGAGLMVTATRTALLTVRENDLVKVVNKLNSVLRRVHLGKRLNMALTLVSLETDGLGAFDLKASGGGMAPVYLLRHAGGAEEHLVAGVPLGALTDSRYQQLELELRPGDVLILMSDGIHERYHPEAGPFGYDGVLEAVDLINEQHRDQPLSAAEVLDQLIEAGNRWAEGSAVEDDVTVVVIKVKE